MPRAQIKDEKMYTELRGDGASKENAARIANQATATSRSQVGRKGGKSGSYDDWTSQSCSGGPGRSASRAARR
jgi:hypothetical protein